MIAPLLPPGRPRPKGGRPPVPARAVLTGILFVLRTGIPWELLPQEMGCGSGMTCWRRLRDWQEAGIWRKIHQMLLDRLGEADQIDWSRASLDSASVSAPGGRGNRPEPDGSWQIGLEAPPGGRPKRSSPRSDSVRGQCARLDAAGSNGRCHRADSAAPGTASEAARQAGRGQGIRLPPLSEGIAGPWHRSPHRASGD